MRRLTHLVPLFLALAIVPSCSQPPPTPTPTAAPIPTPTIDFVEPGDKIGGFLVTTGVPGNVTYSWELDTSIRPGPDQSTEDVPMGTNLNISTAVYDGTYSGKLEAVWAEATYELYIDGQPVDLAAFGTVDISNPLVGTMRAWNVVVVADMPGQFTVHDWGVAGGDSFEYLTTYLVLPQATASGE